MSVLPLSDNKNEYAQGWAIDHRTPIEDRWGGWYVTGAQVPAKHLGNVPVTARPAFVRAGGCRAEAGDGSEAFDATAYLTPHSDVVALLVLNHQLHMTNLLTRLGGKRGLPRMTAPNAGASCRSMCGKRRASSWTTCSSWTRRRCRRPCGAHPPFTRSSRRKVRATAKGDRCASSTSRGGCCAIRAAT